MFARLRRPGGIGAQPGLAVDNSARPSRDPHYAVADQGGTPGIFRGLRGSSDIDREQDPGLAIVAIVEIERFAGLRHTVRERLANAIVEILTRRLSIGLKDCEVGRTHRSTIEFGFRAVDRAAAESALARIVALLEQRIEVEGYRFDLSVAIGASLVTGTMITEQDLDAAAAALASAQQSHHKVAWADTLDAAALFDDLGLMRDLPAAIANGELELYYQPKLRSRTNAIDSVEALLRWQHADRGAVPIERLIALAEETGAILELTEWVIARAIRDQARLRDIGHDIVVHVNVSAVLLPDRNFAARALSLVAPARGKIGFEITETAVIADPDRALDNLHAFAAAGVRIAIDDYGSGLSSLAYLKQLPAHELKIDRLFISGLVDSHRDPLLVRSSIDLAHALEMEVTAEGVDNAMAMSLLRVMGCDLLQGYLISVPLDFDALVVFLCDETQIARLARPNTDPFGAIGGAAALRRN